MSSFEFVLLFMFLSFVMYTVLFVVYADVSLFFFCFSVLVRLLFFLLKCDVSFICLSHTFNNVIDLSYMKNSDSLLACFSKLKLSEMC